MLFVFYSAKNPEKSESWLQQIIISEWFLKDHVTPKTEVMMLKELVSIKSYQPQAFLTVRE